MNQVTNPQVPETYSQFSLRNCTGEAASVEGPSGQKISHNEYQKSSTLSTGSIQRLVTATTDSIPGKITTSMGSISKKEATSILRQDTTCKDYFQESYDILDSLHKKDAIAMNSLPRKSTTSTGSNLKQSRISSFKNMALQLSGVKSTSVEMLPMPTV